MSHDETYHDELLSAYVDGELTEEERAQVEQRLQNDPASRQLVSELQDLSTTLRSLPPAQVGSDLRARILEGEKSTVAESPPLSRRWLWPVAALAAALLLSVYLPQVQLEDEQQLAQKPLPEGELKEAAPEPQSALVGEPLAEIESEQLDEKLAVTQAPVQARATISQKSQTLEAIKPQAVPSSSAPPLYQIKLTYTEPKKFQNLLADKGVVLQPRAQKSMAGRSAAAQQLLVEAPAEKIESVLKACYGDAIACPALQVDERVKENKNLASWARWERKEPSGQAIASTRRVLSKSRMATEGIGRDTLEEAADSVSREDLAFTARKKEVALTSETEDSLAKSNLGKVRVLFILQVPAGSGPKADER